MSSTNNVLEDESDDRTANEVERGTWRHGYSAEYDGEATMSDLNTCLSSGMIQSDLLDVANKAIREFKADEIGNKWAEGSNDTE